MPPYTRRAGDGEASASSHVAANRTASASGFQPNADQELHDNVNLLALSVLSALAVTGLYENKHQKLAQAGLVHMAILYMFCDLAYIAYHQSAVKSPRLVMLHHVASLICLRDPLMVQQHRIYCSAAMLVEINTLLLIGRRKFALWGASTLAEMLFVVTWVALRLVLYPTLAVYLTLVAYSEYFAGIIPDGMLAIRDMVEQNRPKAMEPWSLFAIDALCLLQMVWSVALGKTLVRSWLSRPKASFDSKSL
jgi:hypothetical protein